jgi:hypothetical protein
VDSDSGLALPEKNVVSAEYGLTVKQMQVLGLTNDDGARAPPVEAVSAECFRTGPVSAAGPVLESLAAQLTHDPSVLTSW